MDAAIEDSASARRTHEQGDGVSARRLNSIRIRDPRGPTPPAFPALGSPSATYESDIGHWQAGSPAPFVTHLTSLPTLFPVLWRCFAILAG